MDIKYFFILKSLSSGLFGLRFHKLNTGNSFVLRVDILYFDHDTQFIFYYYRHNFLCRKFEIIISKTIQKNFLHHPPVQHETLPPLASALKYFCNLTIKCFSAKYYWRKQINRIIWSCSLRRTSNLENEKTALGMKFRRHEHSERYLINV